MGCDIHTRVEYLDRNGKWLSGDLFRINPDYDPKEPWYDDPYEVIEVCWQRNYILFATLANVRNYDEIPYIDEPRGIPDDACRRTRNAIREWGNDAHSPSYFTLKELMDYNKKAAPVKDYNGNDYRPLDHLIDELKRRGKDLMLWYDDKTAEERADKLRFVFWFDN